jgi:hypothetical protein
MLDSLGCEALVANCRLRDRDDCLATKSSTAYDEQMDSIPFGGAKPAALTGQVAPQDIEIDRGSHGRVRGEGGD